MKERLNKHQAEYFRALAHPLRIAIIETLREGELTVSEIIEKLRIEQTNASQQLAVLRNTNVISARKQGTSVYYSARNPAIFKLLDLTNRVLENQLREVRHLLKEIESKENRRKRPDSR